MAETVKKIEDWFLNAQDDNMQPEDYENLCKDLGYRTFRGIVSRIN